MVDELFSAIVNEAGSTPSAPSVVPVLVSVTTISAPLVLGTTVVPAASYKVAVKVGFAPPSAPSE